MRLAGPASGTAREALVDIAPMQTLRLRLAAFEQALAAGAFEPFPDGTSRSGPDGQHGSVAENSGVDELRLANAPLSGFDGRLPDYISTALYDALNSDETAFRDFLAIFDRRLFQLKLELDRAEIAIAAVDAGAAPGKSRMAKALRSVGEKTDDFRFLEMMSGLLSRSRSLETLQRLLQWWCQRPVSVRAHFDTRSPIDTQHRSALSRRPNGTNRLGQGMILGRFGRINAGRLAVDLDCASRADLDDLTADADLLTELRHLISTFMRERTPVSVFARIKRSELDPPRISTRTTHATRLGAYSVLTPARHPDRMARIKLIEIYKRG